MSKNIVSLNDFVDEILIVVKGEHRGRICVCDDVGEGRNLIVCFGDLLTTGLNTIVMRAGNVKIANIDDLIMRHRVIRDALAMNNINRNFAWLEENESKFLYELDLIQDALWERHSLSRYSKTNDGKRVFLAHSSQDKWFVRRVHGDLVRLGHNPWIDEINIKVGDSILSKINSALQESDFVIFFASPNSINSSWAQTEWESKYWDELTSGTIKLLVALIEECELPFVLKKKKYADFTASYDDALASILTVIGHKDDEAKVSEQ